MRNWAESYEFKGSLHRPETTAQLQDLVRRSAKVRVLGTRHSFHDIADAPDGVLISLDRFPRGVTLVSAGEDDQPVAVVQGLVTYGQLGAFLDRCGYAVRNLASLPHISVIGACQTATHGSGRALQSLASAVLSAEIVDASGNVVELSRQRCGNDFDGMVVALGALGVVTKVTLELVPRFDMQQYVYENLPVDELRRHFGKVMAGAYSVSLFTDWQRDIINQVWFKALVGHGHLDFAALGATRAQGQRHPMQGSVSEHLSGIDPAKCTQQDGVPGPWHERLPHFRIDHVPSTGNELQSEYILPSENFQAAFDSMSELRDRIRDVIQISEIRTIAADSFWLSPAFRDGPAGGRYSVGIHFTWRKQRSAVEALLPEIERRLTPLGARPHWGKLFTMTAADLRGLYPKMEDFQRLLAASDPAGKFRNPFLARTVMPVT
jgi:xylitol oxidase